MLNDTLDSKLNEVATRRSLPTPDACRLIRQAAGLSQQDVAEILGVNKRTVIRWERGLGSPARRTNAIAYAQLMAKLAERVADRRGVTSDRAGRRRAGPRAA
jgi:transcriptional regulator with XRE-family HTH domain